MQGCLQLLPAHLLPLNFHHLNFRPAQRAIVSLQACSLSMTGDLTFVRPTHHLGTGRGTFRVPDLESYCRLSSCFAFNCQLYVRTVEVNEVSKNQTPMQSLRINTIYYNRSARGGGKESVPVNNSDIIDCVPSRSSGTHRAAYS